MVEFDDTALPSQPPGDPPDPRIGAVVGKCRIVRMLGRGGMGAVYEGRHTQLSRRFAIKFLLPEFATNGEVLARFESEAKAAGGLEHPNLIAVTDVGRAEDGAPYLVMEFLQGEDCSQLLRRFGPLPPMRAADLVLQACRGLVVAHRAGIVHRDLKPENLFVTDAGDGTDRVKVLDFGIAQIRSPDRGRVTRTGAALGTPFYMSPEQARGDANLDSRTDVWSLGVVLYELLSGRRPFEGDRFLHVVHQILNTQPPALAKLRPGLPPGLVALVERAMAKGVDDRLPSVSALAEALLPLAGRTSVPPAGAGGSEATMATPETMAGSHGSRFPVKTGLTAARSQGVSAVAPRRLAMWGWGGAATAAAVVLLAAVVAPRLGARAPTSAASTPNAESGATGFLAAPPAPPPTSVGGLAPAIAEAGAAASEPSKPVSAPSDPRPNRNRTTGVSVPAFVPVRPAPTPGPPPPAAETASSAAPPPPASVEEALPTHHTKIDRANPY